MMNKPEITVRPMRSASEAIATQSPAPAVHCQAEDLRSRIATVDDLVIKLRQRLDSVLRPVGPTSSADKPNHAVNMMANSPLATLLSDQCDRLLLIAESVSDLLNRLEV